mgnify:CR=1 FL=1
MFDRIKKFFFPIVLLICLFVILSALYIEHILSIPACKLCLYQRIPYILSIIICFFGYFFYSNKIFIYLLIFAFLSSLFISGYHLGIENSIFTEFLGCINENLNSINIDWFEEKSMCIVLTSKGYPEKFKNNIEIDELPKLKLKDNEYIFHAGTKILNNRIYSNGGRVLNFVSKTKNLKEGRNNLIRLLDSLNWKNGYSLQECHPREEPDS